MTQKKTVEIKINRTFAGFKEGESVHVDCFDDGVPTDIFWRRRLNDAKHDDCCELVTSGKTKKSNRDTEQTSGGED
jgi:hypothetical protein